MATKGKYIIVNIAPDGECEVSGHNFIGPECDKLLHEVEEAIGETTSRTPTREFYAHRATQARNTIGRGR